MANESKNMPVLPTLMTLGNAICGLAAIGLVARVLPIRGLEVADAAAHAQKVTEALWGAGILIYIGMLFDMLDGQVAGGGGEGRQGGGWIWVWGVGEGGDPRANLRARRRAPSEQPPRAAAGQPQASRRTATG